MNVFSFMVGKKNIFLVCWTGTDLSAISSHSFGFPLERRAGPLLATEVGLGAGEEESDLVLFGDLEAGVFFVVIVSILAGRRNTANKLWKNRNHKLNKNLAHVSGCIALACNVQALYF